MPNPSEVHADLLTRCSQVYTIDRLDQEALDEGESMAFGAMALDESNGTMLVVECGIGDSGNAFAVVTIYDETGEPEIPEVIIMSNEAWITTAR